VSEDRNDPWPLETEDSMSALSHRTSGRLASRAEVAEYLGVPVRTLEQWAYRREGPRYRVIGRHARYRWADVEAWIDAQQVGGAA
jgi:excisionase family DNA binding protein